VCVESNYVRFRDATLADDWGGTNVRSLLFNDVFIHQTRNMEKQSVRTLRSDARRRPLQAIAKWQALVYYRS